MKIQPDSVKFRIKVTFLPTYPLFLHDRNFDARGHTDAFLLTTGWSVAGYGISINALTLPTDFIMT